jgi:hypothetical protein
MSESFCFAPPSRILQIALAAVSLLVLTPGLVVAHGTADNPVSPADLGTPAIVHRLKQMGYTDIRVLREGDDWVDVELRRDTALFTLRASRKLLGPGSLISSDAIQRVELARVPVQPPTSASAPTATVPR